MTALAQQELLENRFNDKWGQTTPIAWENVDYTPQSGTSYVTFRIMPNGSDFASIGKHPLIRSIGLVEINVMTPLNRGAEPGNNLADSAIEVFRDTDGRGWKSGGLRCGAGYILNVRKEDEWYRHIVIIPFEYDEQF